MSEGGYVTIRGLVESSPMHLVGAGMQEGRPGRSAGNSKLNMR